MSDNESRGDISPAVVIDPELVKARALKLINTLEDKGKASGASFRTILALADVEHSTYCRWKKNPPETLLKIVAIEMAAEELMAHRPPN